MTARWEALRRTSWKGLLARLVAGACAIAILLTAAGAVYETVAARGDQLRYPAPGKLVQVNGHTLHLHCVGSGSPTIVLEAGLGESSSTWGDIQPRLAQFTRVCSYDRAGYAWSDSISGPRDFQRIAGELHALLETAGEAGPYVLVGHSIGNDSIRLFMHLYASEVAGLVLIEPTNEDAAIQVGRPLIAEAQFHVEAFFASIGVVRLFGRSLLATQDGAPVPAAARDNAPVVYSAKTLSTAAQELASSVQSAHQVKAVTTPGAWGILPVVVLSASDATDTDRAHYTHLAQLSTNGVVVVAPQSGHYVHYSQPTFVVEQIQKVVAATRR